MRIHVKASEDTICNYYKTKKDQNVGYVAKPVHWVTVQLNCDVYNTTDYRPERSICQS